MIRAGALLYAMFLVIVCSIISSSFILSNYYNNTFVLQALKQEQLFIDVNSGINYGLVFHQKIPYNQELKIDLFEDGLHNVTLFKKQWGAFYVLTSSATWRNKVATKSAIIGANIEHEKKIAIYLADQNKPLSLTGNTKIQGNCYLPKAGVKRAYIEGQGFVGQKLITGEVRNSTLNLPKFNQNLFDNINSNLIDKNLELDSIVSIDVLFNQDTIINSFSNKTLVIYSPNHIVLDHKYLDGNIKILSDEKITVKSTSKISGILLYSKGIIIEKNTSANLQLFSTDSVLVEENCTLSYPTVIGVICNGENKYERKISIAQKVKIKGSIFLFNENTIKTNLPVISIGEESEIMGYVYSSELLELKGNIIGGVYCKNFVLKTPSSVYQNHLMNVGIDSDNLPIDFVGIELMEKSSNHKLIRWLE